ncbi:MAG: hypothetical protein A2751_05380 [Candidatus Doudnabacteria bacterium RIFCSPHIGHO2_01_FULL_46_14]|uniref:DUF4012 domain-containing protein n=1 Tax=Candidatus Doudnabacteria bacterium RIFCSPHIGHO2_01_FULL_46_14 TaxID=1817824 RepID=A0A1F5NPH6_9BACT|nr:MAG: hypothetical protein A2751_05380 [Candidatus Doudnabacteria bacterium RIFCSPHIGHO2_01_FULL_46_14]
MIAKKKLVILRNKILRRVVSSRPIFAEATAGKPLLSKSQRFLGRLVFVFSARQIRASLIFAAGGVLLLIIFTTLSELSFGAKFSKQILGEAAVGVEFLKDSNLADARRQFAKVEQSINDSREIFIRIAAGTALGENLKRALEAGDHLTSAMALIKTDNNLTEALRWDAASNSSSPEFYQKLRQSRETWFAAKKEIVEARRLLESLPTSLLPENVQRQAGQGMSLLSAAEAGLDRGAELSGFVLSLLGGEKKTYVLIFQNNNEARSTGGFIGTYGLLGLGNGVMKISKIESIYALDGQLKGKIASPGPLSRKASLYWGMRDANWFADFPASSRKILEFMEKENGVLTDGVISFTPDFFEELLEITGPVEMPEYGEVLTAQNFRDVVQYKTSIDYDRKLNEPKKFLADFAPRVMAKLSGLDEEQKIKLAEIFLGAVQQKNFLMFSLDPGLQKIILDYGTAGEIKKTSGDFLAIIHSNSGGGKTDQGIEQSVEKKVRVDDIGRQITTLKITRTHKAANEIYLPYNIDFMRIFVPEGSRILSASGFDSAPLLLSARQGMATDPDLAFWDSGIQRDWKTGIYVGSESGYTVFMDWLELGPKQSKTVTLEYVLPQIGRQYSLLLQKQPGAREFNFELDVEGIDTPAFQYPDSWPVSEIVDSDRFYSIVGL